jgi:hypothetical protein
LSFKLVLSTGLTAFVSSMQEVYKKTWCILLVGSSNSYCGNPDLCEIRTRYTCSTYLLSVWNCSVGVLCKSFIALIFALSEDCLSLCCSHCLYFSVFSAKCLHESHYEFYNLQVSTPSRCLAGLFGLGLQLGLVSFSSLVVGHTNSTPWNRELNLQLVLWMQKRMHRSVSSWFKRQKKVHAM